MARMMQGTVVSDKPDKTVVVATEQRKSHPLYSKQYTVTKKIQVHDEKNQAKAGDTVVIGESRQRSKQKCWELIEVLERSEEAA